MKNVFLMLAFMLVGGFAFASSGDVELASNDYSILKADNNEKPNGVYAPQDIRIDKEGNITDFRRHTCSRGIRNGGTVHMQISCFLCGSVRAERRCQRRLRNVYVT